MKGNDKARGQRGMTLIGFVIGLIIFCFFAYMAMVLGPTYNEYFAVKKAMDSVAAATNPNSSDVGAITHALDKQFNVGYVDNVEGKQIKLVQDRAGNKIAVDYEVRKAFVYNIDFVVKFSYEVALGAGKNSD